jgi:hypothetical protein
VTKQDQIGVLLKWTAFAEICCLSCPISFRPIIGSPASPPQPPSDIRNAATPPVATKPCARHGAWVEPSGDDGAVNIAEAALKPRCIASNCWARAWLRGGFRWLASTNWIPWIPQKNPAAKVLILQVFDNESLFAKSRGRWIPSGFPGETACR